MVLGFWSKSAQAFHMLADLVEQGVPVLCTESLPFDQGSPVGLDPVSDQKAIEPLRLQHLAGDVDELRLDGPLDGLLRVSPAELSATLQLRVGLLLVVVVADLTDSRCCLFRGPQLRCRGPPSLLVASRGLVAPSFPHVGEQDPCSGLEAKMATDT